MFLKYFKNFKINNVKQFCEKTVEIKPLTIETAMKEVEEKVK